MALSFGFVSFILFNFLMLAAIMEGRYFSAVILLILASLNLLALTFACKRVDL